jgi:ABC-type transporter MlaC component
MKNWWSLGFKRRHFMRIQLTDGRKVYYEYNDVTQTTYFPDQEIANACTNGLPVTKMVLGRKITKTVKPATLKFHKIFKQYAEKNYPNLFWKEIEDRQFKVLNKIA